MKLCLTLDDVLRNKTVQLGKIYKKYIKPTIDLETLDFSTNNYEDIFEFEDDITDEEIEDEARTFLFNSIEYGWEDYEDEEQ